MHFNGASKNNFVVAIIAVVVKLGLCSESPKDIVSSLSPLLELCQEK